jgi:hypothetical protein
MVARVVAQTTLEKSSVPLVRLAAAWLLDGRVPDEVTVIVVEALAAAMSSAADVPT